MSLINEDTLNKLFASLDDLDNAINNAKKILVAKDSSKRLLDRMDTYSEILSKQRALANTLSEKIKTNEVESISRIVSIISGLSFMLRDDTKEILSSKRFSQALEDVSLDNGKHTFSKEQIC